jgi:hypothetical protein
MTLRCMAAPHTRARVQRGHSKLSDRIVSRGMAATYICSNITSLPPPSRGWHVVSYAPLADGSLGCFECTADIKEIDKENRARIEAGLPGFPYISAGDRGRLSATDRPESAVEFPLTSPWLSFDRLSDGGWVLIDCRSPDGEANARFLDANGQVRLRFGVGDGIEQVQSDDAGGIWVSYFDEGIFGSDLGSAGLTHFGAAGTPVWQANDWASAERSQPQIDDCYALGVVGGQAWACYYSDFPILQVDHGLVRFWSNEVRGARAIAVAGRRVVLFSGWTKRAESRIALLELGETKADQVGQLVLSDHNRRDYIAVGRGDTIHVIGEGLWRQFTVEEVAEAIAAAGDAAAPEPDALEYEDVLRDIRDS